MLALRRKVQEELEKAALDAVTCRMTEAAHILRASCGAGSPAAIQNAAAAVTAYEDMLQKHEEQEGTATAELQGCRTALQNLRDTRDLSWENREQLPQIIEKLKEDKNVRLRDEVVDKVDGTMADLNIHQRGGVTWARFRISLSWQNGPGQTDLDMHMKCPRCKKVVYYCRKNCRCREVDGLHLDVDDTGRPQERSEENMWVKNLPAEGAYVLCIRLYGGPPVPFRVRVQRSGHKDRLYKFEGRKVHEKRKDFITVFTANADQNDVSLESPHEFVELD